MWKVPYINYPEHYRKMRDDVLAIVDDVLTAGDLMLRDQLRSFEANLARFVGTRFALGTANCTDALGIVLRAAGVGPGDEAITVSHTFVATAAAIHHVGASPVLIDIDDDHNMNAELLHSAITPRTKAIVPVHLNGRVCDMEAVMAIADDHGIPVIEDAAQALGATFDGRGAGSFGLAGCFSFYPAKLLGAFGDAGAVVTSLPDIADKVALLRNHGRTDAGDIAAWSFNSRMDNLHAAILDFKLVKLNGWIERRREIASLYDAHLSGGKELLLPPPPQTSGRRFDVFQNYEIEANRRDDLRQYLAEQGIETMVSWGGRGVHQYPNLGLGHFALPRTERMFARVLMLPMHCELEDDQVIYVSKCVRAFYDSGAA